jgi:hypothetical protein
LSDEAVSPVVAAMLVLAIIVTVISVWNALYIPSMKARSEITHLGEVESGFIRFASDIDAAASLNRNMLASERVPLGGGDFTFDTTKSGGTLRIRNETEGYLRLMVVKTLPDETSSIRVRTSAFSYEPIDNFWQDQGYAWSYGTLNVTKGALSTPLLFTNMDTVSYSLAGSLFGVDPIVSPDNPAACSAMNVYLVNISPAAGRTLASGNGNGMLVLESTVNERQFTNTTAMTVEINPDVPDGFRNALWESVNRNILAASSGCTNIHATIEPTEFRAVVIFDFIPNMTLRRKTTEISLAVY